PGSVSLPAVSALFVLAHLLERPADRVALAACKALFTILFVGVLLALAFTLAAAELSKQILDRCVASEGLLRFLRGSVDFGRTLLFVAIAPWTARATLLAARATLLAPAALLARFACELRARLRGL